MLNKYKNENLLLNIVGAWKKLITIFKKILVIVNILIKD